MRSHRASSRVIRVLVACGGVLGLLLAVDAFVAFLFVLMASIVSSGPPNPYVGVVAYVLLPVLVLFGLAVAWGAWEFWALTAPDPVQRVTAATR